MNTAAAKGLGHAIRKAAEASDAQLTLINGYAVEPQSADSVYVRTAWAGHNAIDRDDEVIDDALLAQIAQSLPGKGLHLRHPGGFDGDSGPGVGRIFEAKVVAMSHDEARAALREPTLAFAPGNEQAHLLEVSFYIPRTDKHAGLIADMDAGVAGDVSLGFIHAGRSEIQSGSGERIAMRLHGPGEGRELSLVWLGAQPGARVHKHAKPGNQPTHEEANMELEQKHAERNAAHQTLQTEHNKALTELKAANTKAAQFDVIAAAVGDELAGDAAALAKAAQAGTEYRDSLVDEVVKHERTLGLVGDDEQAVAEAKAVYADFGVDKLKALNVRLAAQAGVGAGAGDELSGDPNARQAKPAQKDASAANPLQNDAIG